MNRTMEYIWAEVVLDICAKKTERPKQPNKDESLKPTQNCLIQRSVVGRNVANVRPNPPFATDRPWSLARFSFISSIYSRFWFNK
jgi:hypothetical protein